MSENIVAALEDRFNDNESFTPFGSSIQPDPELAKAREDQMFNLLTLGPTAVLAGMADTMGNSLGLLDQGDVEKFLNENFQTAGDYYSRRKVPAQTIGDFTGMFIPGLGVMKAYQAAGRIARMVNGGKKSKLLDTIFTRSGRYQQELNAVRMRDRFLTGAINPNRRNLNPAADTYRQLFARRAITTRVSDIIKDNLAFEAGVGIFMNSSDFLYPDEFGVLGNAAIIAGLPATIATGAGLAVRRQLRASLQSVKVHNIAGLALDEIIARAGNRDLGITLQAVARKEVQRIYDAALAKGEAVTVGGKPVSFATIQTDANSEILVLDSTIKQQVENLFKDNYIPELVKAQSASKGEFTSEVNTIMNALRNDESVLLGTFSLEAIPDTAEGLVAVLTRRDKAVKDLQKKVVVASEELQKARLKEFGTVANSEFDEALTVLEKAKLKLDEASATEFYILETDGALIDAKLRKPIYQDGERVFIIEQATTLEPKTIRVETRGDSLFDAPRRVVGVTDTFQVILPDTKGQVKISNINVTKVIKPHEFKDAEHFKQLLVDMGEDWHYRDGIRGKPVFDDLPPDIKNSIRDWTGDSGSSQIRFWIKEGDPKAGILINAYAPMRSRLAEIADNDGTIALYRGEKLAETKNPTNDVVSMTADPNVAKGFGEAGNVIRKRVHIDDVIMIVGGLRREVEYIVKGNTKRKDLGEFLSPGSWEALTLGERSAVYAGLQEAIRLYKPGANKITIGAGDHHTRLDALLELNRTTNGKIFDDVQLPQGIKNVDDIQFASLSSKYLEYARLRQMQDKSREGFLKISDKQRFNEEDFRKMLNLPGTGIGGKMHPLQESFEQFYLAGNASLKEAVENLDHLKRQVQELAFFPQMTTFKPDGIELQGGMLNIPKDMRPVVVIKRPVHDEHYSRKYLQEAVSHERLSVLTEMAKAGQSGAGLVQLISDTLTSLQDMVRSASNVESLLQGQQRGSGLVSSQAFAAGELPAMAAAHNMNLNVTKAIRKQIDLEFKQFNKTFTQIKSRARKGDMASYNLYSHARRQGWEVEEAVEIDGLFFFPMKNTQRNRDRFQRIYGRDLPKEPMMPAPGTRAAGRFIDYKPLGVTPLAMETGNSIASLGATLLRNSNMLRKLNGRPELKMREFWVPPRNFSTGNVAFVMSPTGEMISVTHGRNLADAKRLAEAEAKASGGGTFSVSSPEVGLYRDLEDEAFERMADFTDPLKQTAGITGKQVGRFVDVGEEVLTDQIKGLQRQFDSVLKRGISTYFEPQIAYARQRRNILGAPEAEIGTDVYSTYIRQLLGNNTLNPNELVGRSFLGMEWAYDTILNKLFDRHAKFFNPVGVARIRANNRDNKLYQALEGQLGEHNPFDSALDFANKTHNVKKPLFLTSAKDHAIRLNHLTSLLTLRLFEVGHSVLTLTSLAATIPGVVAAMKKTDLEKSLGTVGHEQYMSRIGAFGIDVGDVAMFSPTRAIMTATHDMFTKEGREVWKRAAEKGYMDQAVSEIFRTLTAPAEGYIENLYRRSTNMASVLSDNAEILARGLSFMTGHSIAKRALGLKNEDAIFAFAHHFANNVIGDYSPNNRPRIFQGAAGMPMGLFMTFMWNYYQRVFGYIENGQTRALVTQFATQASVFGAQTVPGFNQFADMFFTSWDGTVNPVDALNKRFGTDNAEWFMNGIISNIPKMFGSEDGIALYTRGDLNFRNIPTIFTAEDLPIANMFSNFFNGVRKTVGMLRQRGGLDGQQMSEIIQSYSTNRFLRNMASLYSGNITDRRGQVISSDTPSFGDLIEGDVVNGVALTARLMGMRTLNEANRVETHARIKSTDLSRRYRQGELRDAFRSEFRKSKPDPEFFNKGIANYIRQGGSLDNIPNWLVQQYMTSRVDKTSLRLMQIIQNPNKSNEILRLLSAMTERFPAKSE